MASTRSSTTMRGDDLVRLSAIREHQVALEHAFAARATTLVRHSFWLSVLRLVAFLATVGGAGRHFGAGSLVLRPTGGRRGHWKELHRSSLSDVGRIFRCGLRRV